jgi:hypothetical protein
MTKFYLMAFVLLLLAACTLSPSQPASPVPTNIVVSQTPTKAPTSLPSATITITSSPTSLPTNTPTASFTPFPSNTPTLLSTPTQTGTPTTEQPIAISKAASNCRYGPNAAYLYLYGLTAGSTARVLGRNYAGDWLWVQPSNTQLLCWVATTAVNLNVDIKDISVQYPPLPTNPSVQPPTGVLATRSGNLVTISWNAAAPALQLGYLIEASVCSKGFLIDVVATTPSLSYKLTDEKTCTQASSGQVRVQNKLGYSTAVKIPWP